MTNNSSPGMYRQLATLDRERHARLKIGQATDMPFAAGLLLAPLLTSEFSDAAREYSIMFRLAIYLNCYAANHAMPMWLRTHSLRSAPQMCLPQCPPLNKFG